MNKKDEVKIEKMTHILFRLMMFDYATSTKTPEEAHATRVILMETIKDAVVGEMEGYDLQRHIDTILFRLNIHSDEIGAVA